MCTKQECIIVGKHAKNMSLTKIQNQVDKCEKCCFKKEVKKYKSDTYVEVRAKHVTQYWDNHSKYAESQRRQSVL